MRKKVASLRSTFAFVMLPNFNLAFHFKTIEERPFLREHSSSLWHFASVEKYCNRMTANSYLAEEEQSENS